MSLMKIKLKKIKHTDKKCVFPVEIRINPSEIFNYYFEYPLDIVDYSMDNVGFIDSNYAIGTIISNKLQTKLEYQYPVSELLLKNLPQVSKMLGNPSRNSFKFIFYTIMHSILSKNTSSRQLYPNSAKHVGQYFTLGIDSFYTLLCIKERPTYLIYIEGYDVELKRTALLKKIKYIINIVAQKTNTRAIFIKTNLREYSENIISWEQFHGIACASVTYFLYPILKSVYSNNVKTMDPIASRWGTGEKIDRLYSTEYMQIKSFGHDKNRFEKALELSKNRHFDLVLKYIRPCWRNENKGSTDFNCCKCEKCIRTYLALVAATGIIKIEAFRKFSLNNLDLVDFHYNPETALSWQSIHRNLIDKFGLKARIVKKTKRFTLSD